MHSNVERSSNIKQTASNNPAHASNMCTASFDTFAKLQTHKCKKLNIRNQLREIVTTPVCPLCNQNYKTIRNCQDHITKICGPKATPQTIQLLQPQYTKAQSDQEAKNKANLEGKRQGQTTTFTPNIQTILSRAQKLTAAQVKRKAT